MPIISAIGRALVEGLPAPPPLSPLPRRHRKETFIPRAFSPVRGKGERGGRWGRGAGGTGDGGEERSPTDRRNKATCPWQIIATGRTNMYYAFQMAPLRAQDLQLEEGHRIGEHLLSPSSQSPSPRSKRSKRAQAGRESDRVRDRGYDSSGNNKDYDGGKYKDKDRGLSRDGPRESRGRDKYRDSSLKSRHTRSMSPKDHRQKRRHGSRSPPQRSSEHGTDKPNSAITGVRHEREEQLRPQEHALDTDKNVFENWELEMAMASHHLFKIDIQRCKIFMCTLLCAVNTNMCNVKENVLGAMSTTELFHFWFPRTPKKQLDSVSKDDILLMKDANYLDEKTLAVELEKRTVLEARIAALREEVLANVRDCLELMDPTKTGRKNLARLKRIVNMKEEAPLEFRKKANMEFNGNTQGEDVKEEESEDFQKKICRCQCTALRLMQSVSISGKYHFSGMIPVKNIFKRQNIGVLYAQRVLDVSTCIKKSGEIGCKNTLSLHVKARSHDDLQDENPIFLPMGEEMMKGNCKMPQGWLRDMQVVTLQMMMHRNNGKLVIVCAIDMFVVSTKASSIGTHAFGFARIVSLLCQRVVVHRRHLLFDNHRSSRTCFYYFIIAARWVQRGADSGDVPLSAKHCPLGSILCYHSGILSRPTDWILDLLPKAISLASLIQ
eukprot:Gb_31063 [translate_table: standard]